MDMTPGPLRVEVVRDEPGTATLRVSGDLDFETNDELHRVAVRLIEEGRCRLRLDLSGLGLCDSSGLSALIELHRAAGLAGGWLRIDRPNPVLVRLLQRTGLDRVFRPEEPRLSARPTG